MTRPALTVEIAFNAGYATPAASRTWTDVSTYVIGVDGLDIGHGRGDELSTADGNTLRLTLDNRDGRFTAGLSSSPYYPNVKIGRPIRLTATPAGQAASVRYVGYIDEWPVAWPGVIGTLAVTAITATSRMSMLGAGAELRSIIEEEIIPDDPAAYYLLDNKSSAIGGPALKGAGSGTAVSFSGTGAVTDSLSAAVFTGRYLSVDGAWAGGSNWTFEAVLSTTSIPGFQGETVLASSGVFAMSLSMAGLIEVYVRAAPTGAYSLLVTTTAALNDGGTYHLAVSWDGADAVLYVDGNDVDTGTGTIGTLDGSLSIGNDPYFFVDTLDGTVAHVAVWDSALTPTQIAAHADAALNGFAGETPAERLTRYCGYAGILSAETSFETGEVPDLAHIDTGGQPVLSSMRPVETAEGGILFDARDNTLTFHDRAHRYASTSVLTVNVASGELDPSYSPKLDRFGLQNHVTATTTDGTVSDRVVDQDSIDDHGLARSSIDLATTDLDEPLVRASWVVNNYAEPRVRVPKLAVEVAKLAAARQAAVLAVNVGDKITVSNLMDQSDAATKTFFVEGYTEKIDGATYRIEFNVSPAEIFDVWLLDDTTYSVLDSTTRLAY